MFTPGELDQRVAVYRKSVTADGMGGGDIVFTLQNTYWCHVRPLAGKEVEDADRLQGMATYLFVFRNGIDLKDSDRLDWDGEQFNIRVRKQPKSRELYIQVIAERGVGQ